MTIDIQYEQDIEGHRDEQTRIKISEDYVVIVQQHSDQLIGDVVQIDRKKLEEALQEASRE